MEFKRIFVLIALIGTTLSLSAQGIAVKAGVNIASMAEDKFVDENDLENSSVVGFQAGVAFDLGLSDMFTIQPEILFIQKGGKLSSEVNENNRFETRLYYNYLEVPVLAKLKFNSDPDGEGLGAYLIGGPFVGFALNGRSEGELVIAGVTTTFDDNIDFDNEDDVNYQKRLDYGVSFGGGLQFGNLFLDARYNLGLNNLLDDDADNTNDDGRFLRTRGIGLTLGYQF